MIKNFKFKEVEEPVSEEYVNLNGDKTQFEFSIMKPGWKDDGAITFNNANNLREIVKETPLDKILTETDCPYMTPVPYRGERNDPTYTRFTARRIAELREKDTDELCDITNKNGRELFGISL